MPAILCRLFLALFLIGCSAAALAQAAEIPPPKPGFQVPEAKRVIEKMEQDLDRGRLLPRARDEQRISEAIVQAAELHTRFSQCAANFADQALRAKASVEALEQTVSEQAAGVTATLKAMRQQMYDLEGQHAECRVYSERADQLVRRLGALQQQILTERLLSRGPTLYEYIHRNVQDASQWWTGGVAFVKERSGLRDLGPVDLGLLASLVVIGVPLGLMLRRWLLRMMLHSQGENFASRLLRASLAMGARSAPWLLVFGSISLFFLLRGHAADAPVPVLAILTYGITAYVAAVFVVYTLLAPPRPAERVASLPDTEARRLARRIRVLMLFLLAAAMVFRTDLSDALPEHVVGLARMLVVALLALNAAWLVWVLGSIATQKNKGRRSVRALVLLLLAAVIVAELLGFHNLASFLFLGMTRTAILAIAVWVITRLFQDIFDGLDTGRRAWHRQVRGHIGLGADEPMPGLLWLRLFVAILIWGAAALLLLRAWGLSDAGMSLVLRYVTDGFQLGNMRIVPVKVVIGIALFAVLLAASRTLVRMIDRKAAMQRRFDAGAREALVKISGYTGFIVAIIFGLSAAGVDFTNLALVAGALSVGIGFGLQNIVNNFISGLILLFERPIRTGDWVVVGGTEGIVRRISVRSTEIQTFDRADVIVPNAELIASQVKNWTLRDTYGRAVCSVGVAYDTDPGLVKQVLLDIAEKHPGIVKPPPEPAPRGSLPGPRVQFKGFMDNGMRFELVGYVRNVSERSAVESDLYFAIERRFRETGIRIPHPDWASAPEPEPPQPAAPADGTGPAPA